MKIKIYFGFIMMLVINFMSTVLVFSQSKNVTGWTASPDVIHELAAKNSEANYLEEKVPVYTLPDLMKTTAGVRINSSVEWNKIRRPEILELFRKNVFGRIPETPYKVRFDVVNLDRNAISGSATLKQVDIKITAEEKSLIIHLILFTPNKEKVAPVFLLIDNRGPSNLDPLRKVKSEFWPVEEAISRGYGMAVFCNGDVDPDNFDDFRNGIHGILDRGKRPDDAWGTIAAWAWGASRCMDYLVTDKDVAHDKVALVGHSRGGKTALWAGAEDTRFAMVVSNESGTGGAAIARRCFGETVGRINKTFPHWFCTNFKKFNNNVDSLPVDMHMLLALIAPRALYVDCADKDLWGDPHGTYISLYNALPVFRLLGSNSDMSEIMPPLNKQVISGKAGFHIRDGVHNLTLKDWNWFMDFADVEYK